jgi:hypothetical protein
MMAPPLPAGMLRRKPPTYDGGGGHVDAAEEDQERVERLNPRTAPPLRALRPPGAYSLLCLALAVLSVRTLYPSSVRLFGWLSSSVIDR